MTRGFMGMVKGIGIGMALGATAGVVGSGVIRSNKKGLKKTAHKALKTVGNIVDSVQYMVK